MKVFNSDILKDPNIFKENVLDAHADFIAYPSLEEMRLKKGSAKNRVIYDSSLRMSLNGVWKFCYSTNIKLAPAGFEKEDFDDAGFDEIRIPSNMQFEGYDEPTYVNTQYPWEGHEDIEPGQIPEIFNPTGSYIRYFTIPSSWDKNQPVCISFQGVESGFALWVNGEYVGYSEDSFTPSEFDITDHLKDGINKLAVQVYKWTSSSWLEDQDMFRLSGIYRDVFLYTKPKVHIEDIKITASPDADYSNGIFASDIKTSGSEGYVKYNIFEAKDFSKADNFQNMERNIICSGEVKIEGNCARIGETIKNARLWSAEEPYLYELEVAAFDSDDNLYETTSIRFGVRKFEMSNGIMHLNGKRIVFNGVNRHEFSCDNGRSPRAEDALLDLCTMKRNNINAIRTCHYPDDVYIYHLCDELGLYLIAENNMETHGRWNSIIAGEIPIEKSLPGDDANYRAMMLDRVDSTYNRDKNHPAILIWSLGNESFGGSIIKEMADRFRELDGERLIHYEGLFWDRRYPESSDMESQMYTSVSNVEKFIEEHPEKPFIMCEYMHAMGNSIGGMFKYIELTERNEKFQGGFIWDYIDQSVRTKNRFGEDYQAYGGDIGRRPCDYNFSGNGIACGTREAYAKMQEVKACYQPFKITIQTDASEKESNYLAPAIHPEKITATICNKNLFRNASEYDFYMIVSHEGEVLSRTVLDVDIKPKDTKTIDLTDAFNSIKKNAAGIYSESDKAFLDNSSCDAELVVSVVACIKENLLYADAGYEIAFGEKAVRVAAQNDAYIDNTKEDLKLRAESRFKFINSHDNLGVRGENFEVLFSKGQGAIVSYIYAGKEMLRSIPRPNFYRAAVDNDHGSRDPMRMAMWKTASCFQHKICPNGVSSYSGIKEDSIYPIISEGKDYVEVTFKRYIATYPITFCMITYRVLVDGTVRISLDYDKKQGTPDMPEFGFMFTLDADYDHVKWYGLGPDETYCDRMHGGKLSVYENLVEENVQPYLVPQETGNKVGVRWAKVTDRKGRGLIFRGYDDGNKSSDNYESIPGTMEFSALPYTPDQLDEAKHFYELPRFFQTVVRLSLKQTGVGGDDTWGALAHPEFRISGERKLHFSFEFKGI